MFFLEFPCYLYDPVDAGNLVSGSSAFSKSSLYIWKFSVHILLIWKIFEHYLDSMWNKCSCAAVWTFFGIVLLWEVVLSVYDLYYLSVYYRKHFAKNISSKYWYIQHCFNWLAINPKNIIDLLPKKRQFSA